MRRPAVGAFTRDLNRLSAVHVALQLQRAVHRGDLVVDHVVRPVVDEDLIWQCGPNMVDEDLWGGEGRDGV